MGCEKGGYKVGCVTITPFGEVPMVKCNVHFPTIECPIVEGRAACPPGSFDVYPAAAAARANYTAGALCPGGEEVALVSVPSPSPAAPSPSPAVPSPSPAVPSPTPTTPPPVVCSVPNEGTGNIGWYVPLPLPFACWWTRAQMYCGLHAGTRVVGPHLCLA